MKLSTKQRQKNFRLSRKRRLPHLIMIPLVVVAIGIFGYKMLKPAFASANICEEYGSYCIGDPNGVNNGDPVVETLSGRSLVRENQGWTYGGIPVYRLAFTANRSQCVGMSQYSFAEVRDCSGGNSSFVNWARQPEPGGPTGSYVYINVQDSRDHNGTSELLTGSDNGTRFFVERQGQTSGDRQLFDN